MLRSDIKALINNVFTKSLAHRGAVGFFAQPTKIRNGTSFAKRPINWIEINTNNLPRNIMDCGPKIFSKHHFRTPLSSTALKRLTIAFIIQSVLLLPVTNFAALRNAKQNSTSTAAVRSLRLAKKNTFSVSPTSIIVAPHATNGVLDVIAKTANDLKVSNSIPWIKVTTPSVRAFRSSGKLNYSINPNTSCTNRTGVFFVKDQPITVTQTGVPTSYSLSSASSSFQIHGGNGDVSLTANWSWTLQADSPWIQITSAASGSGNTTITFTVAANSGESSRSGSIKILDDKSVVKQIFKIGQSGQVSPVYSLDSTNVDFTFYGGSTVVELGANSSWSIETDAAWITGISPMSGFGDATINYSAEANTSCMSRAGSIKILDENSVVQQVLFVTQDGMSGNYTLSSTYLLFPSNGGRISVGLSARCDWTIQTDVNWISNIVPSNGDTNALIFYTVAENTLMDGRQGYIRVLDGNSVVRQTLRIVQTGVQPTYWLNPISSGFAASGGVSNVLLTANSSWIAQADVDWITNIIPSSGNTNAVIEYTVAANTNATSRVGSIQILDGTMTVRETLSIVQSGAPASLAAANSASTSLVWFDVDNDGKIALADSDGSVVSAANVDGNLYLEKFAADGTALWSKVFGGEGKNFLQAIALDQGNILLVGSYGTRINFSEANENELTVEGATEIFITKLSGDAGYVWSKQLGDFSDAEANAVVQDFLSKYAP